MARKIVFTSGKGGVGKTTVCANLGATLSNLGFRVCILDVDIGLNNLDVVMGIENKVVFAGAEYNFQHQCKNKDVKKDYQKQKKNIKIIHFVTFKKPWYFLKSLDFVMEYYRYSFMTEFRHEIINNFLYFLTYLKNNIKKVKYAFYS